MKLVALVVLLGLSSPLAAQSQRELPPQSAPVGVSDGFPPVPGQQQGEERWWSYRVKGRDALKPVGIRDDGEKTYILFSPNQLLPAIFAISPTGDETLTNGYMRGAVFVLDRVWDELVFRIDGKKATALRNELPDG